MSDLRGRRIVVTGAAGLIGSAFLRHLAGGEAEVVVVRHERDVDADLSDGIVDADLRDLPAAIAAFEGADLVVHAAGVTGGSKQVATDPIPMFTNSLIMNSVVLEAARLAGATGFLFVSNSSVYGPGEEALAEDDAWGATTRGEPENETGVVKRTTEVQCALYARAAEMRVAVVRSANAYGPHDNFDLERSHVVPALIRKAVEGRDPYEIWGAGSDVRDFIHTDDLARLSLEWFDQTAPGIVVPVNLGTGRHVTIRELVELVFEASGHRPKDTRFGGQAPPTSPAKRLALDRMAAAGLVSQISLEEGLASTVEWYRSRLDA